MKQNLPPRRSRGRSNMRSGRAPAHRNQALESNGPEGRVRGTAQQILDRYLAMARDAQSSGDSVLAENLFQHAEHYQRLVAQFAPQQQPQPAPADAQRNADGAQDSEAEARSDREAADRPEAEGGESTNPRPRRRRRQRNAPVEEAAAETGEATQPQEGASAEEATAEAV
ncbi:MAG: DUF4167 domain-containing protein [Alphaproteobacteria bacterium]|nr:DUF4167 domain-containing protein [Alphaproteobacteria bacterium]